MLPTATASSGLCWLMEWSCSRRGMALEPSTGKVSSAQAMPRSCIIATARFIVVSVFEMENFYAYKEPVHLAECLAGRI